MVLLIILSDLGRFVSPHLALALFPSFSLRFAVKHNNVLPNQHFRKSSWDERVKTWLDQPKRKERRRRARAAKAAAVAPAPLDKLRPGESFLSLLAPRLFLSPC